MNANKRHDGQHEILCADSFTLLYVQWLSSYPATCLSKMLAEQRIRESHNFLIIEQNARDYSRCLIVSVESVEFNNLYNTICGMFAVYY